MTTLVVASLTLFPLNIQVGNPDGPEVTAASALVMDATTGRVLWGKNIDLPRYPASTTKIMTGLLLAENTKPSDILTAPQDIEEVTGSSMHLKPGERVSSKDMLRALMLRSANDGAHTIALHISGSLEEFAKKMNQRAKEAGAEKTTFYTPHGLNHPYHMTTALDLARIAREAMKNERFRQTVNTPSYTLTTRSINTLDTLVKNGNNLFEVDPSIHGIKTGYTNPAGKCFVGYNDRDGRKIITVVLRSQDWRIDQQRLAEWTFNHYQNQPLFANLENVQESPVQRGKSPTVALNATENPVGLFSDYDRQAAKPVLASINPLQAPIKAGDQLFEGHWELPDGSQFPTTFLAAADVERKPQPFGSGGLVILAAVSGMTYWMRSRARRPLRKRRL